MLIVSKNQAHKYCDFKQVNYLRDYYGKDILYGHKIGLKCRIKNSDFTLDTKSYEIIKKNIQEYQKRKGKLGVAEFHWTKTSSSLTRQFNISAFIHLFTNFYFHVWVHFRNLKLIDLDLFDEPTIFINHIYLENSDLRFTNDGKPVKTFGYHLRTK